MPSKQKPAPAEVFRPERLRLARQRAALTQEELSQLCGVGKHGRRVSAWETAANIPSVEHLRSMAQALGVSADWLLGLVEDPRRHFWELPVDDLEIQRELAEFDQPTKKQILRTLRLLKRSRAHHNRAK